MIRLLVALLPLGIWAHAHPRLAILAAAALILLAYGIVRACREFGPALAVKSWGAPAWERSCPSCGRA